MRLEQKEFGESEQEQARQARERVRQQSAFDTDTAQKIIALAGRLQETDKNTMTPAQIEAIAQEVGIEPRYIQQAIEATQEKQALQEKKKLPTVAVNPNAILSGLGKLWQSLLNIPPGLWWALAWIMIPVSGVLTKALNLPGVFVALSPFIYVGMGIYLSARNGQKEAQQNTSNLSRQELLGQLFALQKELEGNRTHKAFLSIDVVGSTEMKRNNSELAVEYSFGQYQTWVAEIVRSEGGQLQSSAGDGMMCLFEDDLAAVRAAQRLLQDLSRFNTQQNHLKSPFQIRCGVHAGEVAMEPNMPIGNLQSPQIDYAAALQKHAEPNSILVSGSVSTEALARIGQGEAHPEAVYSWKMP